jgi:nitroreductase
VRGSIESGSGVDARDVWKKGWKGVRMELMNIVSQRRSVRKFLDKPVDHHKLLKCIEAARLAPSADNTQPWRFIVLEDPDMKREFCTCVTGGVYRRTRFIQKAPLIIVLVAKINVLVHRIGKIISRTNIQLIDMGIAGEHLVLQAQELGIGTCWINLFNVKKAEKFLGLRGNYRVVSLIAAGYPAEGATKDRKKLPTERILYFNEEYKKKLS